MANESKLGMAIKEYVEAQQPVPNTLVNKAVVDRLTQLDASTQGWVLHGFPRSREQADVCKETSECEAVFKTKICFFVC